jgi:hypothetical protein
LSDDDTADAIGKLPDVLFTTRQLKAGTMPTMPQATKPLTTNDFLTNAGGLPVRHRKFMALKYVPRVPKIHG